MIKKIVEKRYKPPSKLVKIKLKRKKISFRIEHQYIDLLEVNEALKNFKKENKK